MKVLGTCKKNRSSQKRGKPGKESDKVADLTRSEKRLGQMGGELQPLREHRILPYNIKSIRQSWENKSEEGQGRARKTIHSSLTLLILLILLKKVLAGHVMAHTCSPSTWESETGESHIQAQAGQFTNLVRPGLKTKIKNRAGDVAQCESHGFKKI